MSQSLDTTILWLLCMAIQAWIAARIYRGQLGPSYRCFALYLLVSTLISIVLSISTFFANSRYFYGVVFICWSYAASFFEFLLIRELSSQALEKFPAIRAASRNTLNVFWAVLILVGAAWYVYLSGLPTGRSPILQAALRYQESIALGFTLFVLLFLAFVAWMPVPLTRNILNHCFLMGGFFLAITSSRFVVELGTFATQRKLADYIGLGGVLLVLSIWNFKIHPSNDTDLNTPKGPVNAEEAAVMLARLEQLNSTLSRSGPKGLSGIRR